MKKFNEREKATLEELCKKYNFEHVYFEVGGELESNFGELSELGNHYELYYADSDKSTGYLLFPDYKCIVIHPSGFITEGCWNPNKLNSFL